MRGLVTAVVLLLVPLNLATALEWEDGIVLVRVVDVGAGLCWVAKIAQEDNDYHWYGWTRSDAASDSHGGLRSNCVSVPAPSMCLLCPGHVLLMGRRMPFGRFMASRTPH
jgi:hypothetical protein